MLALEYTHTDRQTQDKYSNPPAHARRGFIGASPPMYVCGRLNLDASTRYDFWFTSIRALVRLNQRRVLRMRFSHVGHAAW